MNIQSEILSLGKANELTSIVTGGGIDYMGIINTHGTFVIRDHDDAGSPDSLDSECFVCLFTTDDWDEGTAVKFFNVVDAIAVINKPQFQSDMAEVNSTRWQISLW